MKTTKIIIAASLVLLTLAMNAQEKGILFATVSYSHEMNRFETWVSHITDRNNYRDIEEADMPVVSQTIYTDFAEITHQNEASFKQWMAMPFDENIIETDPLLEPWMTSPFEAEVSEDDLSLEPWMSNPFETEEIIPIEDWMTAANW